ncbi:TetR/AcrR family transcriptional regulator [Alsobacter sp. R-9]
MSLVTTRQSASAAERRNLILDAAERCFVRAGFHRTTMQDVAAEAGMSAGNLYRYFPSKEAIVSGLSERDREELAGDFATIATADDFLAAFEAMGRKHLIEEPREKAILVMEIWSEATRNPQIALQCGGFESAAMQHMFAVFTKAQAQGAIAPSVDIDMAIRVTMTMADGLFKRRALDPHFDGERELAVTLALFRSIFAGAVAAPAAKPASSPVSVSEVRP